MAWAEETSPGRWRGRYTVTRAGRRRKMSVEHAGRTVFFPNRADAERHAAAAELEARRPGAVDARAGRMTWGQWQRQWWPRRHVEAGTALRDESRRSKYLEPRWAAWPLDEITREDVQQWVDGLPGAPSTVAKIYHLMSASMTAAVVAGKIAASPCVSIQLPRIASPDERYFTQEEIDRICFYLDEPWTTLVLLLAGTGLRWGEMAALHWQRVHLDGQRIDVTMAWDNKLRRYKAPKDHEKRSVPILDWAETVLVRHLRRSPRDVTCGVMHPRGLGQRCSSSLVVPGHRGAPIDYDNFRRRQWEPVVGRWVWSGGDRKFRSEAEGRAVLGPRAELSRSWAPGMAEVAPCTIHDLRHTFASWFVQAGGQIGELSNLLGHSSYNTTGRYVHLAPDRWAKIRERMAGHGPTGERAPNVPQPDLDVQSLIVSMERKRRSNG